VHYAIFIRRIEDKAYAKTQPPTIDPPLKVPRPAGIMKVHKGSERHAIA
jgi:hypothetical protein